MGRFQKRLPIFLGVMISCMVGVSAESKKDKKEKKGDKKPPHQSELGEQPTFLPQSGGHALSEQEIWMVTNELPGIIQDLCDELIARVPAWDIWGFNTRDRDLWVKSKSMYLKDMSWVLDMGVGDCPYKKDFPQCIYIGHDFNNPEATAKVMKPEVNFVSEPDSLPIPDRIFDLVICSEVIEHVINPEKVIEEVARVLKPGGKLLLTAPFSCGLHQQPKHYYTGFTPDWYKIFLPKYGFEIREIVPNGGFFKMLAQECARVYWIWDKHKDIHDARYQEFLQKLFGDFLPKLLYDWDNKYYYDQFTVGYHIEAIKKEDSIESAIVEESSS